MSLSPREQLASATMIAHHELVNSMDKAQQALEALVQGIPEFTCLATEEGRVIWGNGRAAEWFGCQADFVHRQTLLPLFRPEAWSTFSEQLQKAAAGSILEFQLPVALQGREGRNVLWSIRPFDQLSARRGQILLILGRDITEVLAERSVRARLENELETAQLVQAAFFPASHISTSGLEIAAFYQPAAMCSGDWWGHFVLGPDLDLYCIGDVSGHGAASALVTAMTQATCLNYADQQRSRRRRPKNLDPQPLLKQLNAILFATFKGDCYMTFFALLFDTRRGIVSVANAGHNFPFVLRTLPSAVGGAKQRAWPDPLMVSGNPLGCEQDATYKIEKWPIAAGDRYVLFTDGMIECLSEKGRPFANAGLRRTMIKNKDQDTLAFRDGIVADALAHFGNKPLKDDLTLLVIDVE